MNPKSNEAIPFSTALTLITTILVLALNLSAWQYANLVLPLASLLVMIASIYVINMSYGFFVESRGKRQLAGLFGQYVPPELVDEMAKNPESFSLEGESREMTVLFSDVRGFTTISEGLDPKDVQAYEVKSEDGGDFVKDIIGHERGLFFLDRFENIFLPENQNIAIGLNQRRDKTSLHPIKVIIFLPVGLKHLRDYKDRLPDIASITSMYRSRDSHKNSQVLQRD